MNTVKLNQAGGVLRALLVVAIPMVVAWGLIDEKTAAQITPEVGKLVEVVFGAGGATAILAAIWSAWSNRPKAVVEQASEVHGAIVAVYPSASDDLQKLAANPKLPGVVSVEPAEMLTTKPE